MGRLTPSQYGAPWHAESYSQLLHESLPALLGQRLPLTHYAVDGTTDGLARVTLAVGGAGSEASAQYDLPRPSAEGVFDDGKCHRVVVPTASSNDLAEAGIRCVGEQLLAHIAERLGEAPAELPWDESLLGAWLPLTRWVREFLCQEPTAQFLDETNWLARQSHLRRLLVLDDDRGFGPSHVRRACPVETPEGPNVAKVLAIAVGARIEGGRLVPTEEGEFAGLGLSASMTPLLCHTEPIRALMGANMMRQWLPLGDPEPALVQSGLEPDQPGFWCGRNLLTAYVSLGGDTFEDAIVVSESCARRLAGGVPLPGAQRGGVFADESAPSAPLEPGDKLSNRHGQKGVVSRILPDAEMPCLEDGTAVDLVFSPVALLTRLTFGQIREAVLGRVARASGAPLVAPAFAVPTADELRELLRGHGLPEDGMEQLTLGRGGPRLAHRSTVGWVYWGKTIHIARDKLRYATRPGESAQRQGVLEYAAMRDAGAHANIRDCYLARGVRAPGAESLADRLARGERPGPLGPPSPQLEELRRRLAVAGIRAELSDRGLSFSFAEPTGEVLRLARPMPHPWIRGRELRAIGSPDGLEGCAAVVEANAKLSRLLESGAPASLVERAEHELRSCVRALFRDLVTRDHTQPAGRCLFSARSVITPGPDLRHDEVGLPEEMAWGLFGPEVSTRLGDPSAVAERTDAARATLDDVLSQSWVLVNRAPSVETTNILAFRPKLVPGRAIRLVPPACRLMNGDHDGDQVAVLLPLTAEAQAEAPRRLSIAGHLGRSPRPSSYPGVAGLAYPDDVCPAHEAGWGLLELGATGPGLAEISALAGNEVGTTEGMVTRRDIARAMERVLERDGIEAMLDAIDRLWRRGFEVALRSGASMSPFIGDTVHTPRPESDSPGAWRAYADELLEELRTRADFDDPLIGPQLALVRSRTRGNASYLVRLVGVVDVPGLAGPARHGLYEGLSVEEYFALAAAGRRALVDNNDTWAGVIRSLFEEFSPSGLNTLSRAWCARRTWRGSGSLRPGVVFARAAAIEEVDPLTDIDSRLFVGLPVEE